MQESVKSIYTPEEYLAREQSAEYKSEYFNGKIRAMAGGSFNHNLIGANATTALSNALSARPCQVVSSDQRLLVNRNGLYTYPDVMVICGKVEFAAGRTDTITNPLVIIEVLSPSTRDYDRVEKFGRYKQLDTLEEYILVDSERVHVTLLGREPGTGKWTIEMYDDQDTILQLKALNIKIPIRQLYNKVEFENLS